MLLHYLIAIPAIGGILAWIAARWSASACRWIALAACAADLVLSVAIWINHPSPSGFFLEVSAPWIPQFGISYHLGMDGLSLLLVVLTAFLGTISVACSWREITDRVGFYHFMLLLLLTGILGVFLALDLFVFYLFWELMLIPMYLVIALWGHERRAYAAIKFVLFTVISSLFMLVAILGLYAIHRTFDYATIAANPSSRYALWLMLGFAVAFAVKLPVVPLHTWLPDAHTEAPTAGSVILAGLLLKTGAYGFIRFAIPLFPVASLQFAPVGMWLGVAGIIYGAVLAFAQSDFKRMVAYTSVSHMGFVLLGIYAGNELALQGAVIAIIAHGISTGALFLIAGMLQERTHTRDLARLGGLWATIPKMGGFTLLFALAALGLPGMGNFIGEFLVLLGVFQVNPIIAVVGAIGLVLSVIYALRMVQASMLGPNEHNWDLPDLSARETLMLGSLAVLIIWLGLYPQPVLDTSRHSVRATERNAMLRERLVGGSDQSRSHRSPRSVHVPPGNEGGETR